MRKFSLITLAVLSGASAHAEVVRIPQESGFSGYVMGGVGYTDYQSNFFQGPDDDHETHGGLGGGPDDRNAVHAVGGLDLRYTFAETRTQVFLGNLLQDAIRYDFTQQFGVRQELDGKGIVALSYVFNAKDAETWSDPYQNGDRDDTDMTMDGVRLAWDQIWGSGFNAGYTYQELDLDREKSGESLGLDARQRALLDRNGTVHQFRFSYDWVIAPNQALRPEVVYSNGDLDGEAVSFDRYLFKLTYGLHRERWSLTANAFAGTTRYSDDNPVFSDRANSDEYGLGASVYRHKLFGVNRLSGIASVALMESESDIRFYDAGMSHVSTGLLYKF